MYRLILVLVGYNLLSVSGQAVRQCSDSDSMAQFKTYVSAIPQCVVGQDGMTTFQHEFPLALQLFTDDGGFDSTAFDLDAVSQYCMEVANCKAGATACEPRLHNFIENAGMALCQNGRALTNQIEEAIATLTSDLCTGDFEPGPRTSDGCFIGEDQVNIPTYLEDTNRKNKIDAAENRCLYRYMEAEKVCSARSIKALATILAASLRLEQIGRDYSPYTDYAKPALGTADTVLFLHGLTHQYKDGVRQSTCANLTRSHLLFWNTYLKVDGTLSRVGPTMEATVLTQMLIQFSNDAGVVIDSYMTSVDDQMLPTKTQRELGGDSSKITVTVENENLIVLSHPEINTKLAVSKHENGFDLVLQTPTSLLDVEGAGLLVDGCEAYGGNSVADLVTSPSDACVSGCSGSSIDGEYKDACTYDCSNGIQDYVKVYSNIDDMIKSVERDDVVSAAGQMAASLICLFSAAVSMLLTASHYL